MLERLNLNQLRVFVAVYRHRSMTGAAKELHLTQSGVSQHIKALEESLENRLFDRINQKLLPTHTANTLFEGCSRGMYELEQAFWKISGEQLQGVVRLGMPPQFGYNILLPLVAKFYEAHPEVILKLEIGLASAMTQMLLSGVVDFAFIDDHMVDSRIHTVRLYKETNELCASPELLKKYGRPRHTREYYESLPYIAYLEEELVLKKWFAHHLKGRLPQLKVRGYFRDSQGVSKMVLAGLGAGVLPGYLIEELVGGQHKLRRLPGCGRPVVNHISLAYLPDRTLSLPTHTAMHFLRDALAKLDS